MLEQFLNHIEARGLCTKNDRVLLAVSGGLDSMVMAHLFADAGFSVGVAHCNFQLRGAESDADEHFVGDFCSEHSISFFSKRFDTRNYAESRGISIQMAARELRYSWFEELMASEHFSVTATAHHINDSIETILINWIHGSGLEGFIGIPSRNKQVIRPMLFATRAELESYAQVSQIHWREDCSNTTTDYQRNLIRHNVIPELRKLNPSLEQTVQRSLEKVEGEAQLLEEHYQHWKQHYVEQDADRITVRKEGLHSAAGGAVLLWRLTRDLGFNYDICRQVIRGLHGQSGKRFMSHTHQLAVDRDHIVIYPSVELHEDVLIQGIGSSFVLGSWKLELGELKDITQVSSSVWKSGSSHEAALDSDKVSFPLRWRTWKTGDAFYPLGMSHRKKVSDFLIDNKVSVADKGKVTVLESGGEIIWLVGHRIDNRYRITDQTQRALVFTVSAHFV